MILRRRFHFYAAHRNPALADWPGNEKCARLHGHRYGVEISIQVSPSWRGGCSLLFSEIDAALKPIFEALDHRTLLCEGDPLIASLDPKEMIILPFPTSVENLAAHLLGECRAHYSTAIGLTLSETDSAEIYCHFKDLSEWPSMR